MFSTYGDPFGSDKGVKGSENKECVLHPQGFADRTEKNGHVKF